MAANKQGSSKRTGVIIGVVAAAGVAAAAYAGAQGVIDIPALRPERGMQLTQASTSPIFQPPPGAPLSFADIFERVSPAVVSIQVTADVPAPTTIPGFPFQLPGGEDGATQEARAEASGFFISADGYIVTNHHVVADSKEITVIMADDRKLQATVVGTDEATDLAVIKVEGRNFPFVNFENSAVPRVGDWVIAIGNPFGLGGTATAGIVSAYNRALEDDPSSNYVDFLQIDAAINRGNSGGPTFDVYGRVIGVNSAIYSPSQEGGSVGIGFAVPAYVADQITKELIAEGSVTRGFLGAGVMPYTEDVANAMGQEFTEGMGGAFVREITEGGPAEAAGLQIGDVILTLNGQRVTDSTHLVRLIGQTKAGETLRLEILRGTERRTVNARSGIRPSQRDIDEGRTGGTPSPGGRNGGRGAAPPTESPVARPTILGIELGVLDDTLRRQFQIPAGRTGVVVTVVPRALAQGNPPPLARGDLIFRAGGQSISTPQEFIAAVEAQQRAGRDALGLFVIRGGEETLTFIPIPEAAK